MTPQEPIETRAENRSENYLATVSDLVSALIFVFIIMLAVFAYQLAQRTSELTASKQTIREMLDEIQRRLEASEVEVEVWADQGVLRLTEHSINFPSGSEVPITEHNSNVGHLARAIAEVVPCDVASGVVRGSQFDAPKPSYCSNSVGQNYQCERQKQTWLVETLLVEGHTDSDPVAPGNRFQDNLELSSMRAATVQRMIARCEPSVLTLRNLADYPVLSTSGYGSTRPVAHNRSDFRRNRRIDLRFLMELRLDTPRVRDRSEVQTEVNKRYIQESR